MPRVITLLIAPLLLLAALAGCGASTGSSSGAHSSTLTIWYSTDDPVERAWAQQLASRYQTAHPNVHVTMNVLSFEDFNTKLQLALNAGDPPDLAYATPRGPGIPAYLGAHRLLDLTQAARVHHWAQRLRPNLLTEYNAPFGLMGARPGHIVAVPTALAAVGLMVNTRLLHRLDLGIPTTVAQFEQALPRAKAAGLVPLGMGNEDGWLGDDWYLTLINSSVPPATLQPEQVNSKTFSFQRPPFVAAGQTLQNWANRNYFTAQFGGLDAQEGVDQFFKGQTLFQLISSSENAQILRDQQRTHLPIDVFAFPRAQGGTVMPLSGYLGWIVPKAGQNHTGAIDFIDSLLSPTTTSFLLKQGVLPAAPAEPGGAAARWQADYLRALNRSLPGVYLDAAPVANLNATMEANVQLLLQGYEPPSFLVRSLQQDYATRGKVGSTARIDGEF